MSLRIRSAGALSLLLALGFSIVAFVFSIVGITSSEWALRDYYNSSNPNDWTSPNWTMTRSPFGACAVTPILITVTLNDGSTSRNLTGYNHSCSKYAVSGTGRTSCELQSVLKTDNNERIGDARLCQQIHYAGNFGISSTVFICLGSLLVMGLSLLNGLHITNRGSQGPNVDPDGGPDASVREQKAHSPNHRHIHQRDHHSVVSSGSLAAVVLLCIGAILTVTSQLYGILGFIQSSPNNSDFSSSAAGNLGSLDTNIYGFHGPFYQGPALSVYLTCAWAFALATATLVAKTWRMPPWIVGI